MTHENDLPLPSDGEFLPPSLPGAREWERPGVVASSLDVVERFMGRELDDDMPADVQNLPPAHAVWLLIHLHEHSSMLAQVLRSRQPNAAEYVRAYAARTGPRYDYLRGGEVHANEDTMYELGRTTTVDNSHLLKHLILYCDRIMINDPLLPPRNYWRTDIYPNPHQAWLSALAENLWHLRPVADLLRSGAIVLRRTDWHDESGERLDSDEQLTAGGDLGETGKIQLGSLAAAGMSDQFLSARLHLTGPPPEASDAEKQSWYMERLQDLYPFPVSYDDICKAAFFYSQVHSGRLRPIVSNPATAYHLAQNTRATFEGTAPGDANGIMPAARFGIPSLGSYSLKEIALVREDEMFGELRQALNAVAAACASGSKPQTYREYKQRVHECATDLVTPAYDRLLRRSRRSGWLNRMFEASGEGLSLGVDALAGSLPLGRVLQKPYEYLTDARGRQEKLQAQNMACSILESIMRY